MPNFRELRYGEVRRIPIPRTWVNKGKKAGGDLTRIGALSLRELTRRAQPRSFYTSPKSVELLNLAALHDASTLASVKEPLLRGSRREPRVGVLHHPADPLELSAGVQPGPLGVQRPHQAVASRVCRDPIRVEGAPKGVGGYALPRLALAVGIENRIALLVDVPGAPRPATVAALIGDRVEVPADYQLTVHDLHHLRRAGRVARPAGGAASCLIVLGHKVAAPGPKVELPIVVHHRFAERALARLGQPRGVVVARDAELDQSLGGVAVHRVADASRPDSPAVELEVAVGRLAVVGAYGWVYGSLRFGPELLASG